jgi:alpha-galactosidase
MIDLILSRPKKNIVLSVIFLVILSISFICPVEGKLPKTDSFLIRTPKPGSEPKINGPLVYGCRPGNPFLYRIPCQGERPVSFSVSGLPASLKIDTENGIISGNSPSAGEYDILINAKNNHGKAQRKFKIIAGEKLAITPPMGWNHWYAHYSRISDKIVREVADIMVSSGMADAGYQFVNIDDCWPLKKTDSIQMEQLRDGKGNIIPNKKFPDMKSLTDYIHSKGLKAGIYSSPGPLTCAGFTGSYQHEEQDARQFAEWGFDFLKYDLCSYRKISGKDQGPESYKKPYIIMGEILKSLNRDIIYNLCQYGMNEVWKWGGTVGGNSWRTADDLGYTLDKVYDVALRNAEFRQYSKPGEWNDPDYIQIGWFGNARKSNAPEPTKMTPEMQYAYMSLWSLMASPLFFSGDMSKLDDFTLNILCNTEIIEVNQDPLGESGIVINKPDSCFLMVKNLFDGSKSVGLFNRGNKTSEVTIRWDEINIGRRQRVRDLWYQKDLGVFKDKFSAEIPAKGVVMIKVRN